MNKLLKHSWNSDGFLQWKCSICNCIKKRISVHTFQYFYFRNGGQLSKLPECKRIIHCDKTN
jgi:hypothetical protein